MNPETPIMRAIRRALNRTRRVRVVRCPRGFDPRANQEYGLGEGTADLVGMLKGGRVFACEVKTPIGRLSKEQRAWLASIRRWGGFACVARSVPEALDALDRAESGASE